MYEAGEFVYFDRVQKTIRRGKNRVPKSAAEEKPPKLGRAEPAPPAGNQPSRVECRTPSPEPLAVKDDLDLLDSLDSNSLRVDGTALNHCFSDLGSDTFHHANVSLCLMPFSSPSDTGQFDQFCACLYEDPRVEIIWDCYARARQKLALRCEWLRTNALSDPVLKRFRSDNALLAMLEPLLATDGHHVMRELFLANFDRDPVESPPLSDEKISSVKAKSSDGLSPDVDFPSPGTEMPPTPPSCNDYDHGPDNNDFEAAAFAYHLGEIETAETRLRFLTCYEGSVSTKKQVLIQLAWYCLSRVQRESGRVEEADGSLMQVIRGSTFFPATDGTEWDEVSYLFM
ncbi:hypothetical protein F5883DRAFT_655467 [Diaporthe sp. PMI_573]|nr:hypothetical protein F5883DRAFT_655467 [Diaporthaceae sp. PMI_573]